MGIALLGGGKFYGWVVLAAAALAYFLGAGVLIYPFGVFLPVICKEFNWSRGAVSGAVTLLLTLAGVSGPLAGMFIAKFGARRAIVMGNLLGGLGMLLLAVHSHLWQFYVGYGVLVGLGFGFGGTIATTTLANNWFVKRAPLAMSIIMASGGMGSLIMIPVIVVMIGSVGWRSTYMALFAIVLLFGVIVPGLLIRNRPEELGQIPDGVAASEPGKVVSSALLRKLYKTPVDFTVREAMRTGSLWLIMVFFMTAVFAVSMVLAHQVAFLVDMGIAAGIAGTALGLLTGMSTFGRLGIGFLGLRYNIRPLAIAALTLMTIGMAFILVTKSLPMVFVYTVILGIGYGGVTVATLSLFPAYFGRTNYAKIVGFTVPLVTLVGSTGAPLAGAIFDATKSYTMPFTIAVLALILGLICLIFARPPLHPSLRESFAKT